MSQSGAASTHRLDPSLMALMIIRPPSISTSAWFGSPASKMRAAPDIRLASPAVIAESCSARYPGIPSDMASATPSADTTAVCAASGTRALKSLTSQLRS